MEAKENPYAGLECICVQGFIECKPRYGAWYSTSIHHRHSDCKYCDVLDKRTKEHNDRADGIRWLKQVFDSQNPVIAQICETEGCGALLWDEYCQECCDHEFDSCEGYTCINCGKDGSEDVYSKMCEYYEFLDD